MARKFSVAHLTALGCTPPELTYIAATAGYDAVSIRPIYMGLPGEPNYDIAHNRELFEETRTALRDTGLFLNDIELAKIFDGMDVAKYEPAFDASSQLGAKHVLGSVWTDDRSYAADKFGEVCDLAAKYGMDVNLEFVTWAGVTDLAGALDVLRSVDRPNTGVMVDMLHAYRSRVKPEELDEVPKEWFRFAHLCDGPKDIPTDRQELVRVGRDAREYVGCGGIPIADYLRHMPADLTLSIELPNLENVRRFGSTEHVRRCLASAREYLSANGLLG